MLGENLKKARIIKGLTQKEVADYLNVKRPTYTRYESGTNEPDVQTIKKLSDYLEVSIDFLLDKENNEILIKQKEPDAMTSAELDEELFKLLLAVPSDQVQRVKDFVAGMIAAREKPHSDDSDETNEQKKSSPRPTKN